MGASRARLKAVRAIVAASNARGCEGGKQLLKLIGGVRLRDCLGHRIAGKARLYELVKNSPDVAPQMTYRVIGPDGCEREIGPIVAEWAAAIQSGHADGDCLFWDSRAQRWSNVSTLKVYQDARDKMIASRAPGDPASSPPAGVSPAPLKNSEAHFLDALDLSHRAQTDKSDTDPSGDRARQSRPVRSILSVLIVGACLTVAFALMYGDTERLVAAASRFFRQVPWQAYAVASVLIALLALEEFYWFALRLLGIGYSQFLTRMCVQGLSLLSAVLVLYAAGLGQGYFGRGVEGGAPGTGLQLDLKFPERVFSALAAGNIKAALSVISLEHAVVMNIVYACAVFVFTVLLLPRASLLKSALSSTLASALIFVTFYMAIVPLTKPETSRTTETQTIGTSPEATGQAAIRAACGADIENLCPEEQRIGQCLRRQEKLSDNCTAALARARANRPGAQ